ncbi:MAG TPA: TetR/AcrR family transcriptional regulator [Streptosporangiaceae bacterium]|jgi:AcrR family transcriptional regulator
MSGAGSDPGSRSRGRPRDPAVEAAILRAAYELFVERGADGASIERIAKRAGVGKLTVYRRWSSKDDLIAQAIEAAVETRNWPANDELAAMPVRELAERMLDQQAEAAASPEFRALVSQVFGSSVSHPSLMETYWRHYIVPRRRATATMLEQAKRDGTIPSDTDVEVLIDMMAGAVTYRVLQPDPPDATEMRRYLRALYHQSGLL